MSVRSNQNYKRAEEEGETELVLVAVTYTGDRSLYGPQNMRTEGDYPAMDQFRGPGPGEDEGETKLVELPSGSLGWWENHANFEVSYEEDKFARTLLEMNFVPEQIVGPGFDPDVRDAMMDKLDLDPFTGSEDLREQLREVAGVTEEEDDTANVEEPDPRADNLATEDRSVLVQVANSYDDIEEVLEEHDKQQVNHLKSTQLAEFLAGKDNTEVDRRIDTAEQGGDL